VAVLGHAAERSESDGSHGPDDAPAGLGRGPGNSAGVPVLDSWPVVHVKWSIRTEQERTAEIQRETNMRTAAIVSLALLGWGNVAAADGPTPAK
jgi:hypothetical protein